MVLIKFFENRIIIVKSALQRVSRPNVFAPKCLRPDVVDRRIAPKRVTSGVANLRGLALGNTASKSKETQQRWWHTCLPR